LSHGVAFGNRRICEKPTTPARDAPQTACAR